MLEVVPLVLCSFVRMALRFVTSGLLPRCNMPFQQPEYLGPRSMATAFELVPLQQPVLPPCPRLL